MAKRIINGIPFDANAIIDVEGEVSYDYVLFAADLANWLSTYFGNGILVPKGGMLSTELQVTKTGATSVSIAKGNIVINGRTGFLPSPHEMTVDYASTGKQSIDRVVIELNTNEEVNEFRPLLIKGSEANSNPSIPALIRDDYLKIYQMSLARLLVTEDGIQTITDERTDDNLCGISQVLIGVKPPLPVTGDDASNIGYDPSASGLIGTTVQSAIDEVVTIVNNKGNVHSLTFMNVSVPSSLWQATSGYESAKFSATISLAGVTEDMTADVIFAPDEADSGVFSGGCITGTDWIILLAKYKPSNDIVIPTIIASKVVN